MKMSSLSGFHLSVEAKELLGLYLLRNTIGLNNSRQFSIQSEIKPKPIMIHSHTFSRASRQLHVITSSCDWFSVGVVCDWLVRFLWFWFYNTQLKTALLPRWQLSQLQGYFLCFLFLQWTTYNRPSEGRLYNMPSGGMVGSWSSKTNDKSQWIQVDFGEVKRVTQIASQGQALYGYVQWVTKYRVSYSTLGREFKSQDHVSPDKMLWRSVCIIGCMF